MSIVSERRHSSNRARVMRMCLGVTVTIGFGTAVLAGESRLSQITPSAVERMIEKCGVRLTIRKLATARPGHEFGDYDIVLSGVSAGDRRWLALVPRLKSGTDAATGQALVVAVAEALSRNPPAVLRLIRANPSWRHVCTFPMIEPTEAEERSYFGTTIPAVRAVRDADLQSVKRRCLTSLSEAQRR